MKYNKKIKTDKNVEIIVRNADYSDGEEVLRVFKETHAETDFLLSYTDENTLDVESEKRYLNRKSESLNEIELLAIYDGKIVGFAGIDAVGSKYKVKHRAEFGICVLKKFWRLGIGNALTDACIEIARDAGYAQIELNVVADNYNAISLYRKKGFIEYGRNPKGFNSRNSGYQTLVYMLFEL